MEVAEKVFDNIVFDLVTREVREAVAQYVDANLEWESSDEWEDSEC